MEEKLNQIFVNVNEWLKYSEAKNGVLLALNGAMLMGLIALLKDASDPFEVSITWCLIPSFTLSLVILLSSFLPIRDKFFNKKYDLRETTVDNTNLLFYGDLRKLSVPVYLELLYQSYKKNIPVSYEKSEKDLANQILNNSAITYRKLSFFTIGAYIDLVGILAGIILYLLN
jgi:hypothetical protein